MTNNFRAALADEPAVPEGREPAAVTEQPSDEELALIYHDCCRGCEFMDQGGFENAARAVLTRWGNAAPQPPADGEVAEVMGLFRHWAEAYPDSVTVDPYWLTRAADLLQRLNPPQPVPVSERLPGPSECAPWPKDSDASVWCWVGTDQDDGWNWEQRSAGCLAMFPDDFTHWLPAHALPLPEVGE